MTAKNPTTKTTTSKKAPKIGKAGPKAKSKPVGVASDGSLRGMAKPAGWKPETTKMDATTLRERFGTSLRKPQARILRVLAGARAPMTRLRISETSGVDKSWVGDWIGYSDETKRKAQEAKWGHTTLMTLGCVRQKVIAVDGKDTTVYEITAVGRKELSTFDKAQSAKAKK